MSESTAKTATPAEAPKRLLGRFELLALLNKSLRTMVWLVRDPRHGQEMLLVLPRKAPAGPDAMAQWLKMAQLASRLNHPHLGHVVEVGNVEQWPYLAYDRQLGETLDERLARQPSPLPIDIAHWLAQLLGGLAFAHEAGFAHRDIQCSSVLINSANQVRLIGLEAFEPEPTEARPGADLTHALGSIREAASEDILCVGLLLHRLLTGRAVLEQKDLQLVLSQMQPQGREIVRLGWETPHPIPDPLRAIANRSTDRQGRHRYHQARSFARALEGWRGAAMHDDGGPVALLLDKLTRVGHLPTMAHQVRGLSSVGSLEASHTSNLSGMVLQDMALSLELLRRVNQALKQQGGSGGGGTVLNMQRAIAMLGLNGLSQALRSLKAWPGTLPEVSAQLLRSLMKRVHRCGLIAQALRPAGYDAEVVYLIAVLQNFGRLLLQYHFPDDAQQIRQLMQPGEPTEDNPNPAPLSEQAASYAVLGCDLEILGQAVARYWELGDDVLQMMRRQSPDAPVRHSGSDLDAIRLTCSLANELVDAMMLAQNKRQAGVELVARRYARVLGLSSRDIMLALEPGVARREAEATMGVEAAQAVSPENSTLMGALDEVVSEEDALAPESAEAPTTEAAPQAAPSSLRQRLKAELAPGLTGSSNDADPAAP
ncbi:MAG: HDOD domain-containing protein [Burkholderiaceae bacterium]|nr:HDOD domain-containing protein [Burkholderiaceae bacterium]